MIEGTGYVVNVAEGFVFVFLSGKHRDQYKYAHDDCVYHCYECLSIRRWMSSPNFERSHPVPLKVQLITKPINFRIEAKSPFIAPENALVDFELMA